jgi:hypothetical protein
MKLAIIILFLLSILFFYMGYQYAWSAYTCFVDINPECIEVKIKYEKISLIFGICFYASMIVTVILLIYQMVKKYINKA